MLNIEMFITIYDIDDYSIICYFEEGGRGIVWKQNIYLCQDMNQNMIGIRKLGAIDQGSLKISYKVYLNICI